MDSDSRSLGQDAGDPERRHVRGSSAMLVGRSASLLITLSTQVVMVRALTKDDFGSFAYALTLAVAGRQLLSLGMGKMLSRFMAKYDEQEDFPRLFGSMAFTAVTICLLTVVGFGVVLLIGDRITGGAGDVDYTVFLILLLLAPMEALDQVFVSLFAVFSKARSIIFRKFLFTPLLRLGTVLIMVASGAGLFFLAVGYVVTGLLGLLVYTHLLIRELKQREMLGHFRLNQMVMPAREMLSFSLPTLTTELVTFSTHTGSIIILAAQAGVAQVANFRAVMPTARLNQFIFITFVTFFLPVVSRLFTRGEHERLRDTYWHSALILAVLTFPIFAMTAPFAMQTTVTLFGERYASAGAIMAMLSVGYYFNVALGFNAYVLQVYGKLRFLVLSNVAAAALSLGLTFALVPSLGALGVAVANGSVLLAQNAVNQVMLARTLKTSLIAAEFRRPYLVIVLAASLLTAISLSLRPNFVVALVIAALVSLVVLRLARRQLQLLETFPEIRRFRVVASFVG